jgi:hypothetical protein
MGTKLNAPEGSTGCSFDGVEYTVDEKTGTVEVPDEAVASLLDHGFTVAKSAPTPAPKVK